MHKMIILGSVALGLSACASEDRPAVPPPSPMVIHEYIPPIVDAHPKRHHHGPGHGMHHKPPAVIHEPAPSAPEHKSKWQKLKDWKSKHLHHNNSDGSAK